MTEPSSPPSQRGDATINGEEPFETYEIRDAAPTLGEMLPSDDDA